MSLERLPLLVLYFPSQPFSFWVWKKRPANGTYSECVVHLLRTEIDTSVSALRVQVLGPPVERDYSTVVLYYGPLWSSSVVPHYGPLWRNSSQQRYHNERLLHALVIPSMHWNVVPLCVLCLLCLLCALCALSLCASFPPSDFDMEGLL